MRIHGVVGLLALSFVNACSGAAGVPRLSFVHESTPLSSDTVVQEGALEPVLDAEGKATGVEAPNNSINQTFLADHLRPSQDVFDVEASDMKTEEVTLAYKDNLDPNLNYKLANIVGEYVQVIDAVSVNRGVALKSGNVDKRGFKIKAEDFYNGDLVRVRYRDDVAFKKTLKLTGEPVGSVQFTSSVKRCTDRNTVSVAGQEVTVACMFGEKSTHKVSYKMKDPAYQSFTLANIVDPEMGEWRVYANGVEIEDYTRTGATVTITTPLPEGVTVVLVFMPIFL